jgi:hypothetical protein
MTGRPPVAISAGERFGRLVATELVPDVRAGVWWRCACDCGNTVVTRGSRLKSGITKSCGCLNRDSSRERIASARLFDTRDKHSRLPEYSSWVQMWQRCTNAKDRGFKYYGGRGINVCERWKDFYAFLADMGRRPEGLSLDRVNNDGNYEPSNCRWATRSQQMKNRRPFARRRRAA